VHGFPGTPAEMLPLGRLLQREGWTVRGLLLPGFGPEFPGLLSIPQDRWRGAVVDALAALRRDHGLVLLAGYSLGGALSIAAASLERPDALLLLAPFWRLGSPLQRAAGLLLRPFLPQYLRFFAQANFDDPELRRSLGDFFPEADFDDPEFQSDIRGLTVPLKLLGEIAAAGRQAWRDASRVDVPVLILQGTEDELARVEHTRRLAGRFPRLRSLLELPSGHRLLSEESPWWETLAGNVQEFAGSLHGPGETRPRPEPVA
jgi:carboxylesterase